MSFNDISPAKASTSSKAAAARSSNDISSSFNDPIQRLSDLLQSFQKNLKIIKDKIVEYRRRRIGLAEKSELDTNIKELKDFENRLKSQLDNELKNIEALPRTAESAQKRIALGKLQKDFERVRVGISQIATEVNLIKVNKDYGEPSDNNSSSLGVFKGMGDSEVIAPNVMVMQGKEVDDLIMEERERDIKKLHTDLALVNEMFRDMAQIVDKQAVMVEEIAVSADKSHERAQAGLDQVKQAAAYQPGCLLM
jgi:uncharacterized phage infection (PIP) family protein YhgE